MFCCAAELQSANATLHMVMGFRSSATQVLDLAQPPSGSASCSSDEDSPVSSCVSIHKVHSQTHLDSLMSCDSPELLEHTWTCVTPVGDQGGFLSLSQRVQVNRRTLQHLQTNQRTHLDDREHIAQQQFEDGAFMKRHCVPLRADHDLLTPDTLSGVRLHPVQVRSEGMASLSRHLSDSSSSKLAVGSTRRRPPAASPSRRLRFEDETETEAEFRYLERQRRRVGHRGTGVLLSKPDLNLYVNGRAGMKGVRPVVDRQQTELMPAGRVDQCDSCGTVLGGEINLNLRLQPRIPEDWGRSLYKPSLNLRTEPIRETYIGSITAGETSGGGGGDRCVMNNQVRKRTNQVERNENQVTPPQATLNTDLPINPYAPNQLTTPTQPSDLIPPISKCPSFLSPPVTSAMMSQIRHNGTKAGKNQNQNQEESHRELRSRAELKERSPCEERGLDLRTKNSSSSLRTSDLTAECQAPPTPDSSSDGQIIQPMTAELHSDDASLPKHFRRNQSSRLSLRHLFSTVRLSRSRTSSLDRLSSRPDSSASDPSESDPDLLCRRKSSGLLKKTLSVQSLSVQGSPFLQLRKSSSVQIFLSEQKKKDRSADYRPAAEQFLHRCLSLEDVGRPSSVRSVGRVLQVCSDGTFLLEVGQLKNRLYGFIISRGRGRPDSGVYVEDMVDSSTEKLYAGLLEVGDEILEVNGEKVACLSLDQVTHLLTQNTTATIRVLRHRRTIPR